MQNYNSISELMNSWKQKKGTQVYQTKDGSLTIDIDHEKDYFIEDGIVDQDVWNGLPAGKKILFLLKEGYHDDKENDKEYALNQSLNKYGPWNTIWNRISAWTYGIINTDENVIAKYRSFTHKEANEYLHKIAFINIKKSNGQHSSSYDEIAAYALFDKEEILKEIELIDPDIIICGSTMYALNKMLDEPINKIRNENWFYYSSAIGNRERLFIDVYHPSNRYPSLLNYYALVGIYQQALKSKE